MVNEYGMPLDVNGYADSIMHSDTRCYICGRGGDTVRHEVFGGVANRPLSKKYGLWVRLCPRCHSRVHNEPKLYAPLKYDAQKAAMERYGWDKFEFMKKFGRNYI